MTPPNALSSFRVIDTNRNGRMDLSDEVIYTVEPIDHDHSFARTDRFVLEEFLNPHCSIHIPRTSFAQRADLVRNSVFEGEISAEVESLLQGIMMSTAVFANCGATTASRRIQAHNRRMEIFLAPTLLPNHRP